MNIDLLVVVVFLLLTLYVGFRGGSPKSVREFAINKGNFSTSFMVATIFATWVGGEDLIGNAELTVMYGGIVFILASVQFIGVTIQAKVVAPKILEDFPDAISVGDIMGRLYGKWGQLLSGMAMVFFSFGYVAVQIAAIGHLCHLFYGVSFFIGSLIGAGVVILYSVFGGIRSVVWTDFLQFGVLLIAIPVITSIATGFVGGLPNILSSFDNIMFFDSVTYEDYVEMAILAVACSIPIFNPILIQRILMSSNLQQAKRSMMVSAFLYFPFYFMIVIIGLCALILNPQVQPNESFLYIVNTCLIPGVRGIAIIGILAVIMSTADSHLNLASVAAINDVISVIKKREIPDKAKLFLIRLAGVVIGISGIFVANKFRRMIDFFLYFMILWAPIVTTPMMLYVFNIKLSRANFYISSISGLIATILYRMNVPDCWLSGSFIFGLIVSMSIALFINYFYDKDHNTVVKSSVQESTHLLLKVKDFFKNFWWSVLNIKENLLLASQAAVKRHGARYVVFGIFSLVNYMMPFYMWSEHHSGDLSVITIRILAGILNFLLVVSDTYTGVMRKYLPLLWHFVVMYSLPFLTFYMLLFEGPTFFWIININLAIIMGLILLDRKAFSLIFPLGFLLAFVLMKVLHHPIALTHIDFSSIYLLVFSITIIILFFRDQENINKIKLDAVRVFGGSVSHELRTPLSIMSMHLRKINKILTDLNVNNSNVLDNEAKSGINKSISVLNEQCTQMLDFLTISLASLRIGEVNSNRILTNVRVKDVIERVLSEYPFTSDDIKDKISVTIDSDFTCIADAEVLKYVIFNILQNAMYQVISKGKGDIIVSTKRTITHNFISIKDTAVGISKKQIREIFKPFVSYTPGGTGIGLAYCKSAMEGVGADLYCESKEGEYANFIIAFPKTSGEWYAGDRVCRSTLYQVD